MYKVFIYDKPLYITSDAKKQLTNYQQFSVLDMEKILIALQNNENEGVVLVTDDLTSTWENFCSHFVYIEAAGGLVKNSQNEYLFIYRLGKWDLPKGKLESDENIQECAVREVEEECNVTGLSIVSELPSTYHCYPLKSSWALKRSYWYEMTTNYSGKLIPQTEEGIENVEWLAKTDFAKVLNNTYLSIEEVLKSVI